MRKERIEKTRKKVKYPSAVLLQAACYNDYKSLIDRYNKIYDKINIALGFCSAVVLVILNSFDFTLFLRFDGSLSAGELFFIGTHVLCSVVSSALAVWALIQLLLLTKSEPVAVFDSISIRNEEIYRYPEDQASLWLISKYTEAIALLRKSIDAKQKAFDSILNKLIIAIGTYVLVIITQKGI